MAVILETRRCGLAAVLLLVCLSAPGDAASAQLRDTARHELVLHLGTTAQAVDDALASPVRYTGDAFLAGAAYAYRPATWRVGVSGSWGTSPLEPVGVARTSASDDAFSVAVDAWAARRVWRSGEGRWAAFVGPGAAVEVGLRRYEFGTGSERRYDNGFLGLQVAGLLEWSAPWGGRLAERVAVPVVGLAARTSYPGLASEGPDLSVALPPTFVLLRHRLDYVHPLNDWAALSVHHEGSFLRHTDPLEHAVAWQRVGAGVRLRWGGP